jgi:predicted XRE-type DNA-binding protein
MSTGAKANAKRNTRRAGVVREGSGNVFEDLRVPDSGEALAKAELAAQITLSIAARGLTQTRAAELLGVNQADVSDLVRGKLKGFSTDRLLRFLNALGRDVEIVVHTRARARKLGRLHVLEAVAGYSAKRTGKRK